MQILVVGKGGREHALITSLVASSDQPKVFAWPGSPAISTLATCVEGVNSLKELQAWMRQQGIDLCVAGEESCLVEGKGLSALCQEIDVPCWGPAKQSAQLEASKAFSKDFMLRHRIPTAKAKVVASLEEARSAIGDVYPIVLKFNGLAAGKGVAVCPDASSAESFLDKIFIQKIFGEGELLVEECLQGSEVSIFAAVSDGDYQILLPARDYKRIGDGDTGGNTGGMGAVASKELLGEAALQRIEETIVAPTVKGLVEEGLPYRGFLYFGLMLTEEGPQIIEYNCRFGDPECQAVLPLMKEGNFAQYCLEGAKGVLRKELMEFHTGWSVCLILASAGYPDTSRSGDIIKGIDTLSSTVRLYHSGTSKNQQGEWQTAGGRVLALVAPQESLRTARALAYQEVSKISFDGMQRRNDIARLHF